MSDGMTMSTLQETGPAWWQAATLTERLASLRARDETQERPLDAELARDRLERWRQEPPFSTASMFAQRLTADGIREEELLELLGESAEEVRARMPEPPPWLTDLLQAYAPDSPFAKATLPESWHDAELVDFLEAIAPLIAWAGAAFRDGVAALAAAYGRLPFDPATVEELMFANMPRHLRSMTARTLVLELHVARMQGLLEGDTPEARFQSFAQRLRRREAMLAILEEYPVLARQLVLFLRRWVDFSLEFLRHLCADWQAIGAAFGAGSDPGLLTEVQGHVGDTHRGGRAVLIAHFSSGFRVVYKPKSLAVDRHFQELLDWINGRGDHPSFRTVRILDRGDYGWVEHVAAEGCRSADEVRRFYHRQGGYLALLYALDASDFHSENLIAAGEHPVLVDLEALFDARVGGVDLNWADAAAGHVIHRSVLRVGLLPELVWSSDESGGVDISGLGMPAGQLTPFGVPYWHSASTDEMRLARERMEMFADDNRPTLDGQDVYLTDYAEEILAGFTHVYQLLVDHRDELLAAGGPLARFADDEVRTIVRATKTYAILLDESFHPDVLRSALDRDRLFDRLWIGVEHGPFLAPLIRDEQDDLWQGDVPMFTVRVGSRDLRTGGGRRIANFFEESGMDAVRRRIERLGSADCALQSWIVRASLASVEKGGDRAPLPTYPMEEPRGRADKSRMLRTARAIGDWLETRAIRGRRNASWLGMALGNHNRWALTPLGTDLYDGLPGVALFLAQLGRLTGEDRYTALSRAALAALRHQLDESMAIQTSLGGFDGWGGVIYTFAHLGALWNEPALWTEAEKYVELLPPLIDRDEHLDIISGAAGCIGGLLSLHACAPSEQTLAAAVRCGDRLLARARPMPRGVGWITHLPTRAPLTGFSHGAAGMAWALLELAAVSGQPRFRETALAALAYERSVFVPEAGNWPDWRLPDEGEPPAPDAPADFFLSWCHGAPGIGLSRLRCLHHLDDPATREEIRIAMDTTLARGFGGSHTLCHGDLGNLECLWEAARSLEEPVWLAAADRLAAVVLDSIDRHGWLCALPLAVEAPGLMTGLSGIGYGLLRLAEPERVPSILSMDRPTTHVR